MGYGSSGDARYRPWNGFPFPSITVFPLRYQERRLLPNGAASFRALSSAQTLSHASLSKTPYPYFVKREILWFPWADCAIHREPAFEEAGDGRGLAGGS